MSHRALNPQLFGNVTQEHWEGQKGWEHGHYARQVEHVPTSELLRLSDPNVPLHHLVSRETPYLENLGGSMIHHGVKEPVVVGYNHKTRHAMITDGHHRLAVAQDQGIGHLPTRVIRHAVEGGSPVPGHAEGTRAGGEMRPSEIGLPTREP